jgi:invasion protein IalB
MTTLVSPLISCLDFARVIVARPRLMTISGGFFAALLTVALAILAEPAAAQGADGSPNLLGRYGDWMAYSASPSTGKVCFAIARPARSDTTPPGRKRDPAMIYISTRPKEQVKDEISIDIGYPFKPGTDATATIGSAKFDMYTDKEGAFIKNASEEKRMIDAMRKGADLVIKGMSSRGTATTDTFSLKGMAQALDKVAQDCR